MAISSKERVAQLVRERGDQFGREDLDEARAIIAQERDLGEAHDAREGLGEVLWLVVASPEYRGDLTLADLGDKPSREDVADELVDAFLAAGR